MCYSCESAHQKCHNPHVKQNKGIPEKAGLLSRDRYDAEAFVLANQFIVNTPRCLLSGFGCENVHDKLYGGTLFQDAATGIIWVKCQVSLGAGKTIMTKMHFEE